MIILTPISVGELLDKFSILKIKLEKIKDPKKLDNVKKEHDSLLRVIEANGLEGWEAQVRRLYDVNDSLWDIEDRIRIKEKEMKFDKEFLGLARAVYVTNDIRFSRKNEINEMYDSGIVEEKSYESYN